jgi:uncharacterized protein YukE
MSDRVLSSGKAKTAIQALNRILDGELADQIQRLTRLCDELTDREAWDGRKAQQFRSDWPNSRNALQKAQQALVELKNFANRTTDEIMSAGN